MTTKTINRSSKRYKRRRKSKAENVFGAILIEGLAIFALIAMIVFARQATTPQQPTIAKAPVQAPFVQPIQSHEIEANQASPNQGWQIPSQERFENKHVSNPSFRVRFGQ